MTQAAVSTDDPSTGPGSDDQTIGQWHLADEQATGDFGAAIAPLLRPGDVICLNGDMGTGKTCLARSLISARCGAGITVPSPTFNLVLTYDMPDGVPIWHFDLYRISDPEELIELGYDDALRLGISLIEWPQNGGDEIPENHLRIDLREENKGGRTVSISGDQHWQDRLAAENRLDRRFAMARMFSENGWQHARVEKFRADASFRSYDRVYHPDGRRAVLMNAPPGKEDIRPFMQIGGFLADFGFCPPEFYCHDAEAGWLLLEDLGDNKFSALLNSKPAAEEELYTAAIDLLAALNQHSAPDALRPYDMKELLREVRLFTDWYLPDVLGRSLTEQQIADFEACWQTALASVAEARQVLVHRDYHVDNLIWRAEKTGTDRIALLDFQDALAGHPAYDLASLLSDIRRAIPAELEDRLISRFADALSLDEAELRAHYAILAAQRNTKILGIFTRLARRDGKESYLDWNPRGAALLQRDLAHPALTPIHDWFCENLPEGFLKTQAETGKS